MTANSFSLRPLAATDACAVAALIRAAFAGITPPLVPPPSARHETEASVAAHLVEGGGAVAETDDARLVGAVLWSERDGGLYVGRLSVAQDHHRAGVGRALVNLAEVTARHAGFPHMHVGVRLVLTGNRQLFSALGFAETVMHSHDGFAEPTWVEMHKSLV